MEKRRVRREKLKKKKRKRLILLLLIINILIISSWIVLFNSRDDKIEKDGKKVEKHIKKEKSNKSKKPKEEIREALISIAGDFTLGTDPSFSYYGSMIQEIDNYNKDYSQLMRNVRDIFSNDDYTIVNLEGTFTESNNKRHKGSGITYNFKAPKDYIKVLTTSSIEGVTISNNHIYDYGDKGIKDTLETLKNNNVEYCGEGYKIIRNINDIRVGFLGYTGWYFSEELKNKIDNDIYELKNQGVDIIIPYFHWGEENQYIPNETQKTIAHYAIDAGANLVIGSHSHVIQSLENYNGKLIAYSMSNFCFGGNSNPTDKDSFILQIRFTRNKEIINKTEYKIIPVRISSVIERNDYVPTILEGEEADKIIEKFNGININFIEKLEYNNFFEIN